MFNYRVIKTVDKMGVEYYAIYDVYYNCAGVPDGWNDNPICPFGYTVKELKGNYDILSSVFEMPVLEIIDDKLKECK